MKILGLPEWLSAEGEMTSTGKLESSYQHEFMLSGTPLTSRNASVEEINISGNTSITVLKTRGANVKIASVYDNIKNLKAFDASGSEIAAEIDSETGKMHFASAPDKVTYDYSDLDRRNFGVCNSSFGIAAMFAVLLMLQKKRR